MHTHFHLFTHAFGLKKEIRESEIFHHSKQPEREREFDSRVVGEFCPRKNGTEAFIR